MARRTKKQASRGSVNNIILSSLLSGDKYGYEIIKEVEDKTDGKVKLKQPSLYSSLKRFETKKLIESYWGDSDIGGRRHYYRITDEGRAYYKKKNTSIFDDDEDDIEQVEDNQVDSQPYEYDSPQDEDVQLNSKYTFSVEDKMRELLNEDSASDEDGKDNEPVEEMVEPVTAEQTNDEPAENDEELMEQMYSAIDDDKQKEVQDVDYNELEEIDENYVTSSHAFYSPAPLLDETDKEQVGDTSVEQLSADEQPKKSYEIVTDEFGITKLKNDAVEQKHINRVIDNVDGHLEYQDYVQKQTQPRAQQPVESSSNNDINYKDILGGLFAKEPEPKQSNFLDNSATEEKHIEQNENPEPNKYTKQIEDEGFTIKKYTKSDNTNYNNEYLLINKLRFVFGIIMGLLMIVQTTCVLIGISANNLLFKDQNWVYIFAYLFALGFAGAYMIPMFISPNAQRSKSIKFNYSILFGSLAFFVSLILIYAVNTFAGLDFTNISHYLSTILVPAILSSNFIVGTIIYYLLSKNKKFY